MSFVTDEMVEAAAMAMYRFGCPGHPWDTPWRFIGQRTRDNYLSEARVALETAAPLWLKRASAAEIGKRPDDTRDAWETWDAAGRPVPPCPMCGAEDLRVHEYTAHNSDDEFIAECDQVRCDCGFVVEGHGVCADAGQMSGFRLWTHARQQRAAHYREAAAHLEARAAGEDALGEYDTARSLRVGRDALTVRAAEIEKGLTT